MTHNEMTQNFWLRIFPLPIPYPKIIKILTSSFVSTKCIHMDQLISSSQRPQSKTRWAPTCLRPRRSHRLKRHPSLGPEHCASPGEWTMASVTPHNGAIVRRVQWRAASPLYHELEPDQERKRRWVKTLTSELCFSSGFHLYRQGNKSFEFFA